MFVLLKTLLFKLLKQQASKKVTGIVVEKAMQQGMAYMSKHTPNAQSEVSALIGTLNHLASQGLEDGDYPVQQGEHHYSVTIRGGGIVAIKPIEKKAL